MKQDKRKYNGGHKSAGRKGKAEEQKLIEKLSPLEDSAHSALRDALENKEPWAIKLFFEYMYGKPKQQVDVTTQGESINAPEINITVASASVPFASSEDQVDA